MAYETERATAIEAVIKACRVCTAVQETLVPRETVDKPDKSPVTVADFAAQAVVARALMKAFPHDPLVGEEDSTELRKPENADVKAKVAEHAHAVDDHLTEYSTLEAIDRGTYAGGAKGRHWTLDPIDGTKGFLRRDQYAVALALIEDGKVVLGVLGCPNLPTDANDSNAETGCLFIAGKGQGAFMRSLSSDEEEQVKVTDIANPADASFCESVESAHSNQSDSARVAEMLGITNPPFRIDSQCKYAAVSRGDASIYLRLPTKKGYEEKIWDHAAGSIVIQEAGGRVTDVRGKDLDFSIGRTLRDNLGVIVTNGKLHKPVLEAVQSVLEIKPA